MVKLTCETCRKEFYRKTSEAQRNAERGMRTFCSRACRGKKLVEDVPFERRVNVSNLPKKTLDEFSPFRPHLKTIKSHAKKIKAQVLIDVDDLKRQWDKQGGICPLTGWAMTNYISTRDLPKRTPNRASLDRIDSSKHYTIDNIRFICMMAQFAKNNFEDSDVLYFCESVVNNQAVN